MAYDLRLRITDLMIEDPKLDHLLHEQVYQRSGMLKEQPPKLRPFVVYHLGSEVPEGTMSSADQRPTRRNVQIWVHDILGDYARIDEILDRIRTVFEEAQPDGTLLELRFIERSIDLLDPEMHTITRFSRFQATLTE
jgi:hypothetical protein